jgi:hypothetical protein
MIPDNVYAALIIAAWGFTSIALAVGSTASLRLRLSHRWSWVQLPLATLIWAGVLVIGFAALAYLSWGS